MSAPNVKITVTDETTTTEGGSSTIPLIVLCTEQDKLLSDGTVAEGTTKANSNTLMVVSGQKDSITKFGTAIFQTENSTIKQGDELNEYGLHALHSYLGLASTAYVIRGDIDLKQLKASATEPSSNVSNGTYWFDETNTSYGIFRANGNSTPGLAWDEATVVIPTTSDLTSNVPNASFGSNSNVALVVVSNVLKLYEKISGSWYLIGSNEWSDAKPTVITGTASATYSSGSVISINGIAVTLSTGTNVASAVTDINTASILNIVASNSGGALKITNPDGGNIVLADVSGTALTSLGLTEGTTSGVQLFCAEHYNIPVGTTVGSIWLKTTDVNSGVNYVVKQYSTEASQWKILTTPLYKGAIEAEINYGTALSLDSLFVQYDGSASPIANLYILKHSTNGAFTVTGTTTNPTVSIGNTIGITVAVNGVVTTTNVPFTGTSLNSVINDIEDANISGLVVAQSNGAIQFQRADGTAIRFSNVAGTPLSSLGISAGEYSNWTILDTTYSISAPVNPPVNDTLWYNTDYLVDIMVNDGNEWKSLKNNNTNIDPVGVQLTSSIPTTQSDGTPLVNGDLWIDTDDLENYPALYRYSTSSTSWESINKTDQTSPFGIVFADARSNSGPSYTNSTHTAFSTKADDLIISNYVDPDAPDPRVYASGTLLFNTRYSTQNVKKYNSNYFTPTTSTFTVGSSATFAYPGTANNPVVSRWINASGNAEDGSAYMNRKAQRAMVVKAMSAVITNNEDIRSLYYQMDLLAAPGYVELFDELVELQIDRKQQSFAITETPCRLKPDATAITKWANNYYEASSNGEVGRVTRNDYSSMCYLWGLGTDTSGNNVMIPPSTMKLRTIAYSDSVSYPWKSAAGVRRGIVSNASSVGYLTDEGEYKAVALRSGLQDTLYDLSINPIITSPDSGIVIFGDKSLSTSTSALSRENVGRLVCYIRRRLEKIVEPYYFEINNKRTRDNVKAAIDSFMVDLIQKEAIYDYVVQVDTTNNTSARIQKNELWIDLAISPGISINYIYIPMRLTTSTTNS